MPRASGASANSFCSGYYNADANNPYHQDGGYYDNQEGYNNDGYYDNHQGNGQYYDQAGRHPEDDSETFSDFTMRSDMARAAEMDYYGRGDERYNSYAEGGAGYRPPSSQVSYAGNRSSGASTPNFGMDYGNVLPAGQRSRGRRHRTGRALVRHPTLIRSLQPTARLAPLRTNLHPGDSDAHPHRPRHRSCRRTSGLGFPLR